MSVCPLSLREKFFIFTLQVLILEGLGHAFGKFHFFSRKKFDRGYFRPFFRPKYSISSGLCTGFKRHWMVLYGWFLVTCIVTSISPGVFFSFFPYHHFLARFDSLKIAFLAFFAVFRGPLGYSCGYPDGLKWHVFGFLVSSGKYLGLFLIFFFEIFVFRFFLAG